MKRLVLMALACAVVVSLVAGSTVMAAGKHGQAGKPNAELYLYEKDPSTWKIVQDGAWGWSPVILKSETISNCGIFGSTEKAFYKQYIFMLRWFQSGGFSTSPPLSPSPSKERGKNIKKRGFASLRLSIFWVNI